MATSFLKPLKVQGGTFFTFASAAKDISKTFTDDNYRFVFSKFALLDVPDVTTPMNGENNVVWEALDVFANGAGTGATCSSAIANDFIASNNNYNFSQAFQSYALNMEQLVLAGLNGSGSIYDESVLHNTSERIWWHFMKNINAIRWTDANTTNEAAVVGRYKEGEATGATYNYTNVVKYLGDIDVINNISKGGQCYSEIYIHVPTSHGNTPLVLYKTATDANYIANETWSTNSNYIYGRAAGIGGGGLSNNAYYDDMANDQYELFTNFSTTTNVNGLARVGPCPGSAKNVRISSLDGVVLDWNPQDYLPISTDPTLNTLDNFNASAQSMDFKFNCCLVYYDVYDVSNPDNYARNLYGILVVDDYEEGAVTSKLKDYTKFKPNAVTKLNGNSYGLKLNLKFDTAADNVGVETVIREDLTFGMDLFADASVRLQESADMFIDQKLELIKIENRLTSLEQYYFSQDTIDTINTNITTLQGQVASAEINFAGESTLLDLIRENSDNINDIVTGKIDVNLQYNTDVIQPGSGIIVDTSVPNQISIDNKVQTYYNFGACLNNDGFLIYGVNNGITPGSTADGNRIELGEYGNYYRNVGATAPTFNDNLIINIDDSNTKWKTGQTYRIVFTEDITIGTYLINIQTDAQNTKSNGKYGILCGTLNVGSLSSTKPIIDVVCVDSALYSFYIDVIK